MKDITIFSLFDTERDILMHIASLVRVANADGEVLECEEKFIEQMAVAYTHSFGAISFDEIVSKSDKITSADVIDWQHTLLERPQEARNLVKDLIALAYADGDYCDSERHMIEKDAATLGVGIEDVRAIEKALIEFSQAAQNLNAILRDGFHAQ